MTSTKDSQEHLSVNNIHTLIANKIKENPKVEIFSIEVDGKKVWVKRARSTGSNLLHKFVYLITKEPIVIPVAEKTPQEAVTFESSKLQRLAALSLPVPKVIESSEAYFILEDRGPTVQYLIKRALIDDPTEIYMMIITELAALHNLNEFHGGSQIKNFTYVNDTIYFIDFEESFDEDTDIKSLQFRDLFLFLFSLSKLNLEIDYESLILRYITLTKNKDVIQKFHTLTSKVNFLIKVIENRTVWKYIDRDTKSVYRLLEKLKTISPKTD